MEKARKRKLFLAVFAPIAALFLTAAVFLGVSSALAERSAHFTPAYEKQNIAPLLQKESWTEAELRLLYRQTGLTEPSLLALKDSPDEVLAIQEAFFRQYELGHESVTSVTAHDLILGYRLQENGSQRVESCLVPIAPLEAGDVIVTSSCHTFGWRNGHAALVVDVAKRLTFECIGPGVESGYGDLLWFQTAANFLVLRLKDKTADERREIADYAVEHLGGLRYSIFTGIFSPKDQGDAPETTHCSHLVWQAFKKFGFDVDSDGGPVCTAKDIANSDCFELIQVFGFDPDNLWK